MTEWRNIPIFPGYQIDGDGLVRSFKRGRNGRLIRPTTSKKGYLRVVLYGPNGKKTCKVHVLVAKTFIGPRPVGLDICHNDGNKLNNNYNNLRYDTRKGNNSDKLIHGTSQRGELNGLSKLTVEKVVSARKLRRDGLSIRKIAHIMGVSPSAIWYALEGQSWAHVE